MTYWQMLEKDNDTEACYNKIKVLNIGQLRDYQAGIFSHVIVSALRCLSFLQRK